MTPSYGGSLGSFNSRRVSVSFLGGVGPMVVAMIKSLSAIASASAFV
jgi:hypothetical protein